ncbi:MAG: tape measure protein [Promicromonosporaceae bacterium]|nr:tape measure protein [Promicromonosporaceae bacterium]
MAGSSRILTVRILSDASQVGRGLATAQQQYGKFGAAIGTKSKTAGVAVGNSLVNGIDKALGVGLKVAGIAGAAVLGTALFKGWDRLKAIDNAQAMFRGLGYDAKAVTVIMKNATAAVKGTAYSLGDAAGIAATVMAAGIRPGKELQGVLTTVADTAARSQRPISDIGQIFSKVAASNRLYGQEINQLQAANLPILQYLAKYYGVTADAARKMVSQGKVNFADFAAAMKQNVGGAALEAGNTFTGAWDNTLNALARIGANLLSPIFTGTKEGLKGIPALLEPIETWALSAGQAIADMGTWLQQNAGLVKGLGIAAAVAIGILLGFRTVVAVMTAYRAVLAVVKAFQIGYAAATYGTAAASYAGAAGTIAQNVALLAGKAVFLIVAGAQAVATAAQWAWNAAMAAGLGPVLIVIAVIVALVAVFILLWTKCEWFRNFWIGLWNGIVAVVKVVVDWIVAAWNNVVGWLSSVWRAYVAVWSGVWSTVKGVVAAVVSWFQSAWSTVVGWFKALITGATIVFTAVFNTVRGAVSAVSGFFRSAWQTAVSVVSGVIRTLQGIFTSVFNAILTPIRAVSNAFQAVVGWIQSVISWLSKIRIPNILGSIGNLFGGGRALTVTGTYAAATPFAPLARGAAPAATFAGLPRLASLPRLAAGGGGDTVFITVEGGLDSADTIARRIEQLLTARGRRAGGVTVARRTA